MGRDTRDEERERAYTVAVRLVAVKPRTVVEVRGRLLRRGFSSGAAEEAIARLQGMGYLDDAAFAGSWRERREEQSPRSARLVRHELVARGVSHDVASKAVIGMDDEGNAWRVARRRLRMLLGLEEGVFKRRLWAYLQRRGFPEPISRRVVDGLWEEARGFRLP